MSVINRMLQDLESRRGTVTSQDSLARQIRAVPNRRSTAVWVALLIGVLALIAASLWFAWPRSRVVSAQPNMIVVKRSNPNVVKVVPEKAATTVPPQAEATTVFAAPSDATPIMFSFALKPSLSLGLPGVGVRVAENAPPIVTHTPPKANVIVAAPLPPTAIPPTQTQMATSTPTPTPTATPTPTPVSLPEIRPTPIAPPAVKETTAKQRADNAYAAALTLIQEERGTEAVEQLNTVLQQDPGNSAARQTLAGLLISAKRYDEAQRQLQEGLKIDPAQSSQAMLLARLQVEQGNVAAALATLQRSLPAGAERADYQGFIAALLQREGRHREAIAHYQRALRKVPGSGVWLTGMGISLQAENRVAEAKEAFERARATNSLDAELKAFVDQQLQR